MQVFVNGVLVPPADAGSLDGIPASLQPTAGKDGQVVTFNEANDELTLAPASGGFPNPMTAEGDVIIGGAAGAPTKLAVGTAGYFLRVAAGRPAWREFSAVDLIGVRPQPAAVREGMIYWATNGAAGLEASQCWHKGGSTYAWETVPYGVTATGIALVQAANAAAARAAIGITGVLGGGLYSVIPVVPAVGDVYVVSDLDPTAPGAVYTCRTAGAWSLMRPPRVLTQGALHHWRLDQTGTLADIGSANVPLTVTGASWVRNQPGTYFDYGAIRQTAPASGDRLTAATSIAAGSPLTLAITLGAPNAITSWGLTWQIVAWNQNTGVRDYLGLLVNPSGTLYAGSGIANVGVDTSASFSVDWSRAHRCIVTCSSTTLALYIDGALRVTAAVSGTRAAITQIAVGGLIGNAFTPSPSFMAMADPQVWPSAWSAAQVLADWTEVRRSLSA